DRGLDRFFSTRTRAMIEQSMIVANAYVTEHAEAIRSDLLAMAYDLGRAKSIFDSDRDQFQKIISAQAAGRGLSAAILLNPDGSAVDKAAATVDKKIVLPTPDLLAEGNETEPRGAPIPEDKQPRAGVKPRRSDE